ncbi:arsenate reductase 2.2 [Selaginella moellendorffii]|nr:arsenate reductase 2.2 [Selaginella moellendorffii]XP_024529851.1 arsenate reductase 2.2 [Selaginella moellendorffii]|eukprot:XP_002968857.2 arsenate reductase 2.2 [Selaginella moellendorffii]
MAATAMATLAAAAGASPQLRFMSAAQLLALRGSPEVAIIDVRDEDERAYDGHIAGSLHCESHSFQDDMPRLLQDLSRHKTVVFHCALSQVRGPKCAKAFLHSISSSGGGPEVFVLERGFNGWAQYGHPQCSCKELKRCIALLE